MLDTSRRRSLGALPRYQCFAAVNRGSALADGGRVKTPQVAEVTIGRRALAPWWPSRARNVSYPRKGPAWRDPPPRRAFRGLGSVLSDADRHVVVGLDVTQPVRPV